ncbi:hypothetical protein OSH08_14150 [Kaistia geumhonensis]|uniref:Anti-sigma factor NepR domain-containing protein n=1 Tax=Kaistia geumhonensis TaxID=410839 RepID=A0ABU0M183_9HYPH|nr:hypothetical protein [Kaistia geumhonensis]MCX5480153.1 hypothetical protein [Kaistia geumhonensis]MDQ0514618.1 hypothetical protein [Kaistia geumhonensis]
MATMSPDEDEARTDRHEEAAVDDRLGTLLEAIEGERVPERLLKLAEMLQNELSIRRQRRRPN